MMRDINDRVGHYLFSLAVIYSIVALLSTIALALLGLPNPLMWGVFMGFASFVPFVGPPVVIGLVALAGLLTFEDWPRIVAAPAILAVPPLRRIAVRHAALLSAGAARSTPWRCSRPSPCWAGCGARSAPSSRCRC
jgi:hypothetical protein